MTDTQGLLLKVKVHRASLPDRMGVKGLVNGRFAKRFPRLQEVLVDAGYQGQGVRHIESTLKVTTTVAQHLWKRRRKGKFLLLFGLNEKPEGFQVLPRRWVVERTFAWLGRHRRLSKDYEQNPSSSEAWVYLAMSRLMLRRLSI